jgi:two-component system NarL family response regulator
MRLRLVLADDHRMLREALAEMLAKEPDLEIAGEAGSAREALEQVEKLRPDVLVLDIGLPDISGIEVARRLRFSKTKVLMLSAYADKRFVREALKAGAAGYVSKGAAGDDLASAVRAVARGDSYLSPEVAGPLVRDLQEPERGSPPPSSVLAPREREVLKLIAEGARSADIAAKLGITVSTVEAHRRNINRKLGLHTVAELTKYALREGLAFPY